MTTESRWLGARRGEPLRRLGGPAMTFAGPITCRVAGPVVSWHRRLRPKGPACWWAWERITPAEAFDALGPWRMMGELVRARRAA